MIRALAAFAILAAAGSPALAQSLLAGEGLGGGSPYDPPKRLPFKKHDHLQILVQERTRALSSAELKTDRRSRWEAGLQDWISFDSAGKGLPDLGSAAFPTDPKINMDARFRHDNQGRTSRQFDLTFTITAEVVDVRPNGVLVVQATKRRKVNDDDELIRLTGEVAPETVTAGKVRSDSLVNLNITYEGAGSVSDVARPGLLGWLLGKLWPF
jgi:flagellar L-ring protein precursor FlgH